MNNKFATRKLKAHRFNTVDRLVALRSTRLLVQAIYDDLAGTQFMMTWQARKSLANACAAECYMVQMFIDAVEDSTRS